MGEPPYDAGETMARAVRLSFDDPRWRRFVAGRGDATPFHDPDWAILLADCYGLDGFVLAEVDDEGAITAGLPLLAPPRLPTRPRRLVSLPFTDAVRPLVDGAGEAALTVAIDSARRELGVDRVELRAELAGARPAPPRAVIHTLALDADPDVILSAMTRGKRRDVRAAQRSSLVVRHAESEQDLTETFYRLHLETRRRLGVPSQPKRFFRLLWRRLIDRGRGHVLAVFDGSVPVAAAVFLAANGTMVYKYSASDARRRSGLPNDLLLWTAIRGACADGHRTFDFGRTELAAAGLRSFKARWGGVERPLVYSAIGDGAPAGVADAAGRIGRLLRHSPVWVTRATGAVLYRYAA